MAVSVPSEKNAPRIYSKGEKSSGIKMVDDSQRRLMPFFRSDLFLRFLLLLLLLQRPKVNCALERF